jgi:hypothetical protein
MEKKKPKEEDVLYLLPMVKLFGMVTKKKDKKMWGGKNKNEVKKIEEKNEGRRRA